MTSEPVVAPPTEARLAHLDRLKIVLTAGVIVAHAAMTYGAAGTWVYEQDALSAAARTVLSALVGGGVLFVLGLFFLVAGALTTGPLRRRGPRRFLVSRLGRLGIPVLAYAVVVWPVLQWVIAVVEDEPPSLWVFYRRELSDWESLGTGPLWFVAVLLVVTVGWCLWRWRVPASPSTGPAGTTVLLAATTVAVGTFLVRTRFPVDSPQFLDAHVWIWPQAMALFMLGAVGAERDWIWLVPGTVQRGCRVALLSAVLLLALLVVLSAGPDPFKGGWHWEAAGLAVCEGAISVGVSLLVLDWSRRHVVPHGRVEHALAGAAYGAFVAQGPVLVGCALAFRPLDIPGEVLFLGLAVLGVAGSFACGWVAHSLATTRRRS
jgi:hypothetical protein